MALQLAVLISLNTVLRGHHGQGRLRSRSRRGAARADRRTEALPHETGPIPRSGGEAYAVRWQVTRAST